jgi:hypothetical protein
MDARNYPPPVVSHAAVLCGPAVRLYPGGHRCGFSMPQPVGAAQDRHWTCRAFLFHRPSFLRRPLTPSPVCTGMRAIAHDTACTRPGRDFSNAKT